MRNGDLSNEPAPRIYVVFDDCMGKIPDESKELVNVLIGEGNFDKALSHMDFNYNIIARLGWLSVRKNVNIYLVTWMGEGMAQAIETYMSDMNVPVRGCLALTSGQLARMTAQDDSVMGIYDPDPKHALSYGAKGRIIRDERDLT